ncbi:MAG: tyrosine-protein phosphatase [Myxococcaceae bacterium]|nr:tyrosine-protein phosphatase [Myxococcaceae bacterium]
MRAVALALACVAAVAVAQPEGGHCEVPGFKGVRAVGPGLYVGGEQDAAQLAHLKELGVVLVVDLREAKEPGARAEAAQAAKAKLQYRRLEVAGASGLTEKNARALDALIREAKGAPVLVHCKSGERSAALLALRDGLVLGRSKGESLSFMRRAELLKFEAQVSALLEPAPDAGAASEPGPAR